MFDLGFVVRVPGCTTPIHLSNFPEIDLLETLEGEI